MQREMRNASLYRPLYILKWVVLSYEGVTVAYSGHTRSEWGSLSQGCVHGGVPGCSLHPRIEVKKRF
jgi:hypothetical protein